MSVPRWVSVPAHDRLRSSERATTAGSQAVSRVSPDGVHQLGEVPRELDEFEARSDAHAPGPRGSRDAGSGVR